jgi:hypothetical protein
MRGRLLLAGVGVAAGLSVTFAQFPPPAPRPLPPGVTAPPQVNRPPESGNPGVYTPGSPRQMPPTVVPQQPGLSDGVVSLPPADFPLPYPENKAPFDPGTVAIKRVAGGWQVWAGPRLFRDCGANESDAREITRLLREMRPTEWATIGTPKPLVEYGLVRGRPSIGVALPHMIVPVNLTAARVEPVRGVWCLRDDDNLLFNFGANRADAEQALAVVRKYGFNRVGVIGTPGQPAAMSYFFASLDDGNLKRPPTAPVALAAQEAALARTGIPVPGVGFFGEMVRLDPKKVAARKDGYEWVVASGPDVIGRFGPAEWPARDAAKAIADGGFTEFCRAGTAGLTFFLVNGQAPTRVPYAARGRRFDLHTLKVQKVFEKWTVTEGGRHLFDVGSADEGEAVIRMLRHFQFDQVCHLGPTPRTGVQFLAKSR